MIMMFALGSVSLMQASPDMTAFEHENELFEAYGDQGMQQFGDAPNDRVGGAVAGWEGLDDEAVRLADDSDVADYELSAEAMAQAPEDDWDLRAGADEYLAEEGSHVLDYSRQNLSVVILEPADGEVLWTEDLGASFDVVMEIHGGGLDYGDRGARIDADAFVELNGQEIWHGDGSLNSAELSIWHSRATIEVAHDGTILQRFRAPHTLTARLVDGTDEIASVTNAFDVACSAGGQGWAQASPYNSPWTSRGRAGLRYLNSVAIAFAREIEKLEACLQDRRGAVPPCPVLCFALLRRLHLVSMLPPCISGVCTRARE